MHNYQVDKERVKCKNEGELIGMICTRKKYGGFNLMDLEDALISLLNKWVMMVLELGNFNLKTIF
jgi:hypothetical protein